MSDNAKTSQLLPIPAGLAGPDLVNALNDRIRRINLSKANQATTATPAASSSSSSSGTVSSGGYLTVTPDGGGNVAVNLSSANCFRLVLDGTASLILAPSASSAIPAGALFSLYLDQDATGGRSIPSFASGSGGFASDSHSQVAAVYVGKSNTRTRLAFRYHGSIWCLDAIPFSGGAIS